MHLQGGNVEKTADNLIKAAKVQVCMLTAVVVFVEAGTGKMVRAWRVVVMPC